ncbi:hypothetical protein B0I72DRAFT_132048 [Yarrowia lipolytica]|nr:hypothetical protein B0I72DRAFT_132048 [Yarrowia lipolytica]RDW42904.1 hypothetical protein B0I74DRAFT_162807 [Yarrowia lipolytica]RDW50110.1 hypothetical protein B0I75DRAFT_131010 [Yarrowia lipolytica]
MRRSEVASASRKAVVSRGRMTVTSTSMFGTYNSHEESKNTKKDREMVVWTAFNVDGVSYFALCALVVHLTSGVYHLSISTYLRHAKPGLSTPGNVGVIVAALLVSPSQMSCSINVEFGLTTGHRV